MKLYRCIIFAAAYKHADGKKIDGRRVLVDVERGRTVKGWRPRRLGQCSSYIIMKKLFISRKYFEMRML